jgi:hypothetical protein
MSVSTTRYNKINNKNLANFKIPSIKSFLPNLTETDYSKGYIVRYFCQKANDKNAPITEISSDTYSQLYDNSFTIVTNLDWKISGTHEDIKEANLKSIKRASKDIASIHMYLPYLLQFSKQ